jgi:hypothetical protein
MSLSSRIAEFEPPVIGGRCRICNLSQTLPADEVAALDAALVDQRISNASLSQILKAEGFQVGETTVRRHRRGECKRLS